MALNENAILLVRLVFLYGCYSAKEFEKFGFSSSAYGRYKDFLRSVFGEELEEAKLVGSRGKILRFRHDKFESSDNTLLQLFRFMKPDPVKAVFFLKILQNLPFDGNGADPLTELVEATDEKADRTYERWINDLVDMGYLSQMQPGKAGTYYYSIPAQLPDVLSDEELLGLCDLVDLGRSIYPPGIFADYLLDTLKFHLEQRGMEYSSPFFIKHLHMLQVLDDDKLWKLIGAIHACKILRITTQKAEEQPKECCFFQPYKIVINETDGRRCVWGTKLKQKQDDGVRIFRLDRITAISEETDLQDITILSPEQAEANFREESAASVTGATHREPNKELVTGVLTYPKQMYSEVHRMFPDAEPESLDEDTGQIRFSINTGKELRPFLQQHIGKIRLTACSDDTLTKMQEELQKWRALYGLV